MPEISVYAACEVRGPNLIFARRCVECGALATTADDRVMGRLPESCRRNHGNHAVEIPVEVPSLTARDSQDPMET